MGHSPGSVPCSAPRQPLGSFPSTWIENAFCYTRWRSSRSRCWFTCNSEPGAISTGTTFWRESGNLGKPPHIYHLFHAVALIYLAIRIACSSLEDFPASRATEGFILEAGRAHPDWFYRPGAAGTSRRTDPPLSDCAPRGLDVLLPVGGLGGGAHLRHWSFHAPAGSGGLFRHRAQAADLSPKLFRRQASFSWPCRSA